ncbi:PAS domain-containing protein [Mucilaginibacter agri]|uniref:histidine kinase n=1 Tax=Mucilaginibacter agri TaxID=2695265 RepID=A0A965ZCL5_9SPHI|nr:PAS domain-containing protein [Mucilaginibacter agri]NCD68255.1 PAS domain-containing protein [Mucilaginibacter agri]
MQLTDDQDLRYMVLHAPIGICLLDSKTLVIELVNDKFLEVAGRSKEALLGKNCWNPFAELRTTLEQELIKVAETGEPFYADEAEMKLIRHGKEEVVFMTFVYNPVKNSDGKVTKIAAWVLESTKQVRERQLVTTSEKRFRALVTASSDVIYSLSADWKVMQELDGRGFLKDTYEPISYWRERNVHPDDLKMVNLRIKDAIRYKKIFEMEHRVIRADGSPGWTFSRAVPILDSQGEIVEWFGTASDITERKRIEDALRNAKEVSGQQQRLYEAITSGTPDLMYVFDLNYRFIYVNSALLSMWGKTYETAIGKSLLENGYEPWHAEMHEREIDQVKATGLQVRGEVSFPHSTLGRRMYDYILSPVFNEQGQVEAVSGITRDITEQKNNEQRLQLLINMLPAAVVVIRGPELVVEMINQANLDYWKKSAAEVVGKPFLEILPDLADQPFAGQLRHVMATGEVIDVKESPVLFENPDGSIRETFVDYTYQPLADINGDYTGVLVMSFEITDRVLARRQVEQSEENLRAMISQAPVAMCILSGADHVITVANQLMVELWGKPQSDVMNRPVFDALPDARGQGLEEVMKAVYETGETFYANELPVSLIRHGRPEVVYQNFVYQAYRDATGAIGGVIAITVDVTEQVQARKTIEKTQQQLEAELAKKDGFIGMASHELKTPLTSLNAIIQVANAKLKQHQDPFLVGAMGKANQQVRRMMNMINGFLNISRLESGKIHIEKRDFDIRELISEIVEELSLTPGTQEIRFTRCDTIEVHADRDKIGSVVSNLISNALKYSPKTTKIKVDCTASQQEVVISIKDSGIGIAPDDLAKIFDRYYRVEADQTRHIAGFGIGLYLSSEIVQRHGGKIWAKSEPGKGSIFYFSLPLNRTS